MSDIPGRFVTFEFHQRNRLAERGADVAEPTGQRVARHARRKLLRARSRLLGNLPLTLSEIPPSDGQPGRYRFVRQMGTDNERFVN